ncbi:MAG: acetyltransferase, partial [Bacteroidaceae bacterium]|nr:acetyltransferase [Bacteroidaceae bacterium]
MYRIVFSLCWLISLLPLRVLYVFSDFMYLLVRFVVRYRRKVVRKNLRESFPEKTEKELREIERKFYHAFCDYFVEDIKCFSMSKEQMMKRMTFGNAEWLKEGFEKGDYQIVLLFLGHFGNWEWIASIRYSFP